MPVRFITDKDSTLHYEKQLLTDEEKAQARENIDVDVSGTATKAVSEHDSNVTAHEDIRALITELSTRLTILADSDDTTLDQMSELVAYIKSNKTLIDSVTTSKVSVSDVVNNLMTDDATKPLSAAQGVALKALIDALEDKQDAFMEISNEEIAALFE